MELMDTLKHNASKFMSSAVDVETIAIDQLEKITSANVDSLRYYSDVNIRQLRAMARVHDIESLRQFITGTISLTGEIATRMINDSQRSIAFGTEIRDAILNTAQQKAAPEKKAGKRSASA